MSIDPACQFLRCVFSGAVLALAWDLISSIMSSSISFAVSAVPREPRKGKEWKQILAQILLLTTPTLH